MFEGLLQPMHLLLILGIALLVFGPRRLPEIGRGLGEGIRSFRESFRDAQASSAAPRLKDGEEARPVAPSAPVVERDASRVPVEASKPS